MTASKSERYRDIVTGLSVLISLGAVLFTGLQWSESRTQLILLMKPSVDFDIEDDPDEAPYGIAVTNAGPGPAVIKSVTYYFDRKPVKDSTDFIDTAKLKYGDTKNMDFDIGDTLAVNGKVWLLAHKKKGKDDQKEIYRFIDVLDNNLGIKISFCSIEGTCWEKCSTKGFCD